MKNSPFTLEHALYALAAVLAVGVRFLNLGVLQLSDFEAGWALQALHVVQGLKPTLGPDPAYVHLTAVLFSLFGATEFLARFWPALAGSALALVPIFFRDRLGRLPALVLTFGLALDPGLAALSRLAGGSMLAVAFVMLAWAMWKQGQRAPAGIFAALAALSGPSAWFGLLGLVLAWAIDRGIQRRTASAQAEGKPGDEESGAAPAPPGWETLRIPLAWGLGTLLVVGSLLLFSPKGLAATIASFWSFLSGWWTLSDVLTSRVLISLPVYELMPLAFGLAAAVRGVLKRDRLSIGLGVWVLVALILAVIHPDKQVADLAWAILPLWTLAALELGRHFDFEGRNLWELAAVIAFLVVLLAFGLLDVATVTTMDPASNEARLRLYLLAFILLLAGLSLLLVGGGWSTDIARLGGVWGGVLVLAGYTLAMLTGTTGLRLPLTEDLWLPEPRTVGTDLLVKTLDQISDWNRGAVASLPVTVAGVDSPALFWALRDWDVQAVAALAPTDSPALVITSASVELGQEKDYRGEGFTWQETASWDTAKQPDWLSWLVYHQMPVQYKPIILWVRGDLMLENQGQPAP
jgi:hypothetical protein